MGPGNLGKSWNFILACRSWKVHIYFWIFYFVGVYCFNGIAYILEYLHPSPPQLVVTSFLYFSAFKHFHGSLGLFKPEQLKLKTVNCWGVHTLYLYNFSRCKWGGGRGSEKVGGK